MKRNLLFVILFLTFIGCGGYNTSSTQTNLIDNSASEENRDITVSQKRATGALVPTEDMLIDIPEAIPVSSYSSNELPSSFDLSNKMPPVRSQGNQGSCASWAVGYYLKSYHEHIDKKTDYGIGTNYNGVYSPAFLYNTVKVGGCDSGSYISKNLDRVQNVGISTWEDMSYSDKDCSKKPSSTATKNSKCARILEYNRIRIHKPIESMEMQDMKYYLYHGNPIVVGIYVYDGFNNPKRVDGEFIYKDYEERGARGGHAIVVVGYDDSRNAFKIINSWGTNWGNDGFLWIDYDVFSRIVFVAYRTEDALGECEEGSSYISLNKQSLIFNAKLINHSYKKSFKISNSGSVSLEVSDINTPNGYSVDWKHGTIKAGEYKNVTVTFKPTEEKVYNGTLIIESDADKGKNSLNLSGEGIDETSTNLPPIANAGENITVKLGESVTLDGSKSSDDGEIVSYEWRLGDILLSDSKKFTKDDFSEGTHRVTLKVTDDKGLTDTDTIIITITKENNLKPIANAGENISAKYGDSIILDGSKSKDSDGKIIDYEWKEGNKILSNSVKFIKKDFSEGKHTITLEVTDDKGATDTDIIIITIAKKGNIPPIANAGDDITILLGESIEFDASKSYDTDGEIVKYEWSSSSINHDILLHYPKTIYSGLRLSIGKHIFTLTVTDNEGITSSDTMTITVKPNSGNLKPVIIVSAYNKTLDITLGGYKYNIIRPNDNLKLYAGSSFDPDGEKIMSYQWKEKEVILSEEDTLIKDDFSQGEHLITLTLTDNKGAKSSKDILIKIGRENNINPVARTSTKNIILTLGAKLELNASNSYDSDGSIIYYYLKYSPKEGYNNCHCSSGSNFSFYPNIEEIGIYTFTLIVMDNDGAIDTETITVTVVE